MLQISRTKENDKRFAVGVNFFDTCVEEETKKRQKFMLRASGIWRKKAYIIDCATARPHEPLTSCAIAGHTSRVKRFIRVGGCGYGCGLQRVTRNRVPQIVRLSQLGSRRALMLEMIVSREDFEYISALTSKFVTQLISSAKRICSDWFVQWKSALQGLKQNF